MVTRVLRLILLYRFFATSWGLGPVRGPILYVPCSEEAAIGYITGHPSSRNPGDNLTRKKYLADPIYRINLSLPTNHFYTGYRLKCFSSAGSKGLGPSIM